MFGVQRRCSKRDARPPKRRLDPESGGGGEGGGGGGGEGGGGEGGGVAAPALGSPETP